jgi:(1->4)-alpha-D-glucan 1-alpha-D-glucosylmutase
VAAYAGAIVELSAALPVYRTYLDAERPEPDEHDRRMLERAFSVARTDSYVDRIALDALERVLLGAWGHVEQELGRARRNFVLRWQQLTGPAAAKGVEDTALYAYAPLTSRNEVGGDPSLPLESAVERLHARLRDHASQMPRSLNATNTHDTKRSADVRARLDVLSERASDWEHAMRRWRRWHQPLRTLVQGRLTPTRTTDDFIYQAMIGLWPLTFASCADPGWLDALRGRLSAYVLKAVREAKVRTSWTHPDAEYEAAITGFLTRVLDSSTNESFLRDMGQFVRAIAPQALWNALGRLVVQLTAPGVPDLYQGDELWFAALVDPDNRRPVDWTSRVRTLDLVSAIPAVNRGELLRGWRDDLRAGELKMFVLHQLLALRQEQRALFESGGYEALRTAGTHAGRVVAFRRAAAQDAAEAIVVVSRLTGVVGDVPIGDVWGETLLEAGTDEARDWRCVIQGGVVRATGGRLRVGEVFRDLPVAVLLPVGKA